MNNEQDNWRTPAFRNSIRAKIEEQFKQYPTALKQETLTMENSVFNASPSKEDYLMNIRKLLT